MEPSGRNQWQPVAKWERLENGRNKPKPLLLDGKEGVNG